jgi:hypothetical protein
MSAINMLLTGATDTAIAAALQISRKTLYNWKTRHEEFRATLAARRANVFDHATDRFRHMLARALDNFDRHLADPYAPLNLRASRSRLTLSRIGHHLHAPFDTSPNRGSYPLAQEKEPETCPAPSPSSPDNGPT